MSVALPARPYRPDTRIEPGAVTLINRLARSREPLLVAIEGLPLVLVSRGICPGNVSQSPDDTTISFDVGERLNLRLPAAILDRIAQAIQPDLAALPSGIAGALLLELALAPLLDVAEQITGFGLRIEDVGAHSPEADAVTLLLDGTLGDIALEARLSLRMRGLGSDIAVALVEALPRQSAFEPDLLLPVSYVAGYTRLLAHQLTNLTPGDVVMPDIWHLANDELFVAFGSSHGAMGARDSQTVTLISSPRSNFAGLSNGEVGGITQQMTKAAMTMETKGIALDDIDVTLTFELGRRQVTIAELKGVGAGHVFDLALLPAEAVDLMVNGSRIGLGEIVEIGERLGIRVVRLFGQERDAPK